MEPRLALRTHCVVAGLIVAAVACGPNSTIGPDQAKQREERVLADADRLFLTLQSFWTLEVDRRFSLQYDRPEVLVHYLGLIGIPECGESEPRADDSAYYCPVGTYQYVGFDLRWFVELRKEHPGPETTAFALAHEWAHSVQFTLDSAGREFSYESAPERELQADCLAGSFLAADRIAREFEVDPSEADEVLGAIRAVGGPMSEPGDHGTIEQRQASFVLGFRYGVGRCRRLPHELVEPRAA